MTEFSPARDFIAAVKAARIPGTLYLEGSYAAGGADKYSDLDFSLEVSSNNHTESVKAVEHILHSLGEPLYILNYGEDREYPGYSTLLGMYQDTNPFQILDVRVKDQQKKNFRGERKEVHRYENSAPFKARAAVDANILSGREKEVVKFWFLQPGLVKKILRRCSAGEIKKAFELKVLHQLKYVCSESQLFAIHQHLQNHDWFAALKKGWRLFSEKTKEIEPKDAAFANLKAAIHVIGTDPSAS